MATRKVMILARGLGTRMSNSGGPALDGAAEEMARAGLKGLIPLAGRPFLDYLFGVIVEAGFREACLVIGPDSGALKAYGEELGKRARLDVYFAVQKEPRGTADAVAAGEGFAEGESFVMLNSDNWMPAEGLRLLREARSVGEAADEPRPGTGDSMALRDPGYEEEFGGDDDVSEDTAFGVGVEEGVQAGFVLGFDREGLLAGNIPADRVKRFGVLDAGLDGKLQRVVEKPDDPEQFARNGRLYVSMNCWQFPPAIFDACRAIKPSPRGELEITDAVQWLIDHKRAEFRVLFRSDPVYDLTGREDIGAVGQMLAGYKVPFPAAKG